MTSLCAFVCAQQEQVQLKAKDLEKTVSRLQKSVEEGHALIDEKNIKIDMQAKREKELIASVHRCLLTVTVAFFLKLKPFNSQFITTV